MKRTLLILVFYLSLCIMLSQTPLQGVGGVFYKGTSGVLTKSEVYDMDNITGVAVMFHWQDVEPSPGEFDWSLIDEEIKNATEKNKKISLLPLGAPDWICDLGCQCYAYVDENTYHPTYGQILKDVITWDTIYINRFKIFLKNLAEKYADNQTVCYVNTIAGPFSRGFPDSVVTNEETLAKAGFWEAFDYNADSLSVIIKDMIDYYMLLFPQTPLWFSVDYIKFEKNASGRNRNYLADLCINHGIENYPGRFGLFREDIQPCNPKLGNIPEGSHWYLMSQNPCRTGAQMLWHVQDGPERMNKCGISPNTKQIVLDSAIQNGLALGMRYVEVYGVDIKDGSLQDNITKANDLLSQKADNCMATTNVSQNIYQSLHIYPHPVTDYFTIDIDNSKIKTVLLMDGQGRQILCLKGNIVNASSLPNGLYILYVITRDKTYSQKLIKE